MGAYRLAHTDTVRRQFGVRGLYTATLFRYGDPFLDRLGPALELGARSFGRSIKRDSHRCCFCGKAIGAFRRAGIHNARLSSARSASAISTQAVSRELMVSFLEKYASLADWAGLVRNRRDLRERVLKGPIAPSSRTPDSILRTSPRWSARSSEARQAFPCCCASI